MFNSLNGEISGRDGERLFLTTGNLEWEIWTCERLAGELERRKGSVRIFTHVYHRDDQLRIYGFPTVQGRNLFLDLIRVEGVGPRLALKIMSGMSVEDFVTAVEEENILILESIPGLGRKTAQKIVLNLKGRLASITHPQDAQHDDIVSALVGMGFDRREAKQAVFDALEEMKECTSKEDEWERELLRLAIRMIGQKR